MHTHTHTLALHVLMWKTFVSLVVGCCFPTREGLSHLWLLPTIATILASWLGALSRSHSQKQQDVVGVALAHGCSVSLKKCIVKVQAITLTSHAVNMQCDEGRIQHSHTARAVSGIPREGYLSWGALFAQGEPKPQKRGGAVRKNNFCPRVHHTYGSDPANRAPQANRQMWMCSFHKECK